MKKFKILNLYACLGGNRYKWDEVADNLSITAVELDPEAARLYQERFPNDTVVIADAHQYLLDHYKEFDFIWSSPPCPTHSKVRYSQKNRDSYKAVYPSMSLYEEILFLDNHFKGKYVVENVIPYYKPLIKATEVDRHLYWSNFRIPKNLNARHFGGLCKTTNEIAKLSEFHDYDFYKYKGTQRRDKMARNLVDYEVGRTILEVVLDIDRQQSIKQISLFY